MLWLWFMIGLALTILGAFALVHDNFIKIKGYELDTEILGTCFLTIGGILAGAMLLALGINWCFRG